MEHIFNIAINVEDEKIVKRIEETAEAQVIDMICSKVEDIIYEKNYWKKKSNNDLTPLREIVNKQVEDILNKNKDYILNEAAKILADKLARSKAGKALLEVKEEEK